MKSRSKKKAQRGSKESLDFVYQSVLAVENPIRTASVELWKSRIGTLKIAGTEHILKTHGQTS
jgi:hypothetical protein